MRERDTILGARTYGAERYAFGVSQQDRLRHLFVIGKTGSGKSTLLENVILQDIEAGRGVAFLDPLGDSAERIIDNMPGCRLNDIVYFNPSDLAYPVGFNVVETVEPDLTPVVAAGVVSTFKHVWRDAWGARLEWVLYHTAAAILECPNTTLLAMGRMLREENFRRRIVAKVRDPQIRKFWTEEFAEWDARQRVEFITSTVNKLDQFTNAPVVRNILGQIKSTIDLRYMIDNRRILIANLSKGLLGEDRAHLLGALLVTKIQLAAMSRANIPARNRVPFNLVIDELQNFTTDTITTILSEARKYGLGLTLATQYLDQLSPKIRKAIFGNIDSIVTFRVGESDADVLSRELECNTHALVDLGRFEVRVKILRDGDVSQPFFATTEPFRGRREARRGEVTAHSRRHFTRPRGEVEERIHRWLEKR